MNVLMVGRLLHIMKSTTKYFLFQLISSDLIQFMVEEAYSFDQVSEKKIEQKSGVGLPVQISCLMFAYYWKVHW